VIANSVTVQPDGKILIAGFSDDSHSKNISVVRYNINGSLDDGQVGDSTPGNEFGPNNNGIVTMDINGTEDDDVANAVIVQPDLKILVVGYSDNAANKDILLVRFNSDGSPDSSFGPFVNQDYNLLPNGTVRTDINHSNDDDVAYAVVLQQDGKILVAGYSDNSENKNIAIVRYKSNGSRDPDFGRSDIGTVLSDIYNSNDDDVAYGMTLQDDGKIVVAGRTSNGVSGERIVVARYKTDGSTDSSFGGEEIKRVKHTGFDIGSIAWSKDTVANGVVLAADGSIMVAGVADMRVGGLGSDISQRDMFLGRFKGDKKEPVVLTSYTVNQTVDDFSGLGGEATDNVAVER
jgi:uncharacterized delta-60 repeat protein